MAKDGLFSTDEVSCARELIDSALCSPGGDYRLLVAAAADEVLGYVCYGPTPMTQGTFDLYWLVTAPAHRGRGVARALCHAMEEALRAAGGRLIRVETSTMDGYGAAARFYARYGFPEVCRVPDFYRPGEDLIVMIRAL